MRDAIDLHSHSTASDGTFSPAEVVAEAKKIGLTAIALTDHDTVAGLPEAAAKAEELGIEFVPGCELAVSLGGRQTIDILGYWVPLNAPAVTETMEYLNQERYNRNVVIAEKLAGLGLDITYDEIRDMAQGTVGRPHIARVLMQKGYVSSVQEAFDVYLGNDGKAYVPKTVLTPEKAIEILKKEQATVVLAHPGIYSMNDEEMIALVTRLKGLGLDGIECYYSEYSHAQTEKYLDIAKRFDLCITGGSDFHGSVKPTIKLGRGKGGLYVPAYLLTALKKHRQANGLPV